MTPDDPATGDRQGSNTRWDRPGAVSTTPWERPPEHITAGMGREVVQVPCRALIWQNGSLHCISMQLPAGLT